MTGDLAAAGGCRRTAAAACWCGAGAGRAARAWQRGHLSAVAGRGPRTSHGRLMRERQSSRRKGRSAISWLKRCRGWWGCGAPRAGAGRLLGVVRVGCRARGRHGSSARARGAGMRCGARLAGRRGAPPAFLGLSSAPGTPGRSASPVLAAAPWAAPKAATALALAAPPLAQRLALRQPRAAREQEQRRPAAAWRRLRTPRPTRGACVAGGPRGAPLATAQLTWPQAPRRPRSLAET